MEMALLWNKKTCASDGVKVNIKYYTLSKSWVKWWLQDHNTKSFIVRNIILYWRLFPGHSFHKIVRFYIVVLEEGCSKTDMEMIGISLRVLFWLVLTRFRKCLHLLVWDAICLRPGSHSLAQSH